MKKLSYLWSMLSLYILALTACSDPASDGGDKQIQMPYPSEQIQQAYADDETTGGFTFTAKSPWTATITESDESRSSSVTWLKLLYEGVETYRGDAGKFTMTVQLEENDSGKRRSAIIVITGGGDSLTVTVTQEGKKRGGTIPQERRLIVNITETAEFNSDYYNSENSRIYNPYYYEFKYDEQDRLKEYWIRVKSDGSLYEKIILSYDVQGEIRLSNEQEGYEQRTCTAELGQSGYVSKLSRKYTAGEDRTDFEYREGYLAKIMAYIEEHEQKPDTIVCNWSQGNMESFDYNGKRDGAASFAPEANDKANIDLNAFFFGLLANDHLFEYPNDMEENILAMADRFGKRSRNYMTGREHSVDEESWRVDIYTQRNEPAPGTVVRTVYDREFYGDGTYSFDTQGYPVEFTHQVKVVKDLYIYRGERNYIEPQDERQQAEWLRLYGEGPYFTLTLDNEETVLYDTYTYRITYKE